MQSMNTSGIVSTELGLVLVAPEDTIVPLMASLHYTCRDPYAIKMAFHIGTDEPVEWTFARDLLEAALHSREGIGDVQAWPSPAPGESADEAETATGSGILNIAMSSPFGQAEFQAPAEDVASFLRRTYEVVPVGDESRYVDFDAELSQLLSEA
jgi:Streptomyces sporulation and cell division protein, SsgA